MVSISPALSSDARAIADVHVRSWQNAYSHLLPSGYLDNLSVSEREAQWSEILAKGQSPILVARVDGALVGWICFGRSRDADASPETAEIMAFYALPSHWSRGVGRSLWLACLSALVESGFSRVTLWVIENNLRGIRFYESAGFAVEPGRIEEFELGGVVLKELRYVRHIHG